MLPFMGSLLGFWEAGRDVWLVLSLQEEEAAVFKDRHKVIPVVTKTPHMHLGH